MTKTDKKLDQLICNTLHGVCETALSNCEGFEWLTHTVNYKHFPASLQVCCVFTDKQSQQQAIESGASNNLTSTIVQALADCRIKISPSQVTLDNEQACDEQHLGNWNKRLLQH